MLIALLAFATSAAPNCRPAVGNAAAILHRAADVMGMSRTSGRVLRINGTDVVTHDYESDRPYLPYILQPSRFVEWFDAASGADRISTSESRVGGYQYGSSTTLGSRLASYGVRDTSLVPSAALHHDLDDLR